MNDSGFNTPSRILTAKSIAKSYKELEVLRPISFDLKEGEFLALLGSSGCGKSTLLSILADVIPPSGGELKIREGAENSRMLLFQQDGLLPWRCVGRNVGLGLEYRREPKAVIRTKVADALRTVGLNSFSEYYPHQLSGGMRQRVAIARALVMDPDLLLLDEPFGSLDAITRLKMHRDLLRLWEKTGKTIVMVTHDVDEAISLADRVMVLSPRPAAIVLDQAVDLPRPRDHRGLEYDRLRHRLLEALGLEESSESAQEPDIVRRAI